MDINEFKKAISKSFTKNIIGGAGITLFGVLIISLVVAGVDTEMKDMSTGGMIVIWLLAAICLLFGISIITVNLKGAIRMKKGQHPIVNAIQSGEKDFLIWMYEYVTKVKGGGSDHQVWAYDKDGNKVILSLRKKRVRKVLNYLSQEFPDAAVGYSEELRDKISLAVGKKL